MSNLALQKAIEETLAQDSSLPPIYDGIRQSATYPYITLGRDKVVYEDRQMKIKNHIFIYSQAFSIAEVKKHLNKLVRLLESNPLAVENHQLILNIVRSTESMKLGDGKTYRGELVLETIIETN